MTDQRPSDAPTLSDNTTETINWLRYRAEIEANFISEIGYVVVREATAHWRAADRYEAIAAERDAQAARIAELEAENTRLRAALAEMEEDG